MDFPDRERRKVPSVIRRWILFLAAGLIYAGALGMLGMFLGQPEYVAAFALQILSFPLFIFAVLRWGNTSRRIDRIHFGRGQQRAAGLCAALLGLLGALVVAPDRAAQLLGPLVTTVTGRAILLALAIGAIAYITRSVALLAHDEAVRAGRLEDGPPAEPEPRTPRTSAA